MNAKPPGQSPPDEAPVPHPPIPLCVGCGERPRVKGKARCYPCLKARGQGKSIPYSQRSPEHRQRTRDGIASGRVRKKYGVSLEEASELRARPCEVCGRSGPNVIDHIVDGSYCGVLCSPCNTALGLVGDSP